MQNKFVFERLGLVGAVIMSERPNCIRMSTGAELGKVASVDITADQARTLARQLYHLARRLDARTTEETK